MRFITQKNGKRERERQIKQSLNLNWTWIVVMKHFESWTFKKNTTNLMIIISETPKYTESNDWTNNWSVKAERKHKPDTKSKIAFLSARLSHFSNLLFKCEIISYMNCKDFLLNFFKHLIFIAKKCSNKDFKLSVNDVQIKSCSLATKKRMVFITSKSVIILKVMMLKCWRTLRLRFWWRFIWFLFFSKNNLSHYSSTFLHLLTEFRNNDNSVLFFFVCIWHQCPKHNCLYNYQRFTSLWEALCKKTLWEL